MDVLYVVVPLAIAFAGLGVLFFTWGVRAGQFDDLTTPAHRMLLDEESAISKPLVGKTKKTN